MTNLTLPGDQPTTAPDLAATLAARPGDGRLAGIVLAIAGAAPALADRLALGHLPGDPAAIVGVNESGDRQKALDVGAHEFLLAALAAADVGAVLSEEAEDVTVLSDSGAYDVAIDPIDGSGSIGIGAPLGLLFAVFPAGGFLRSGREVVAAGYVSFGHSIDLGFSLGDGVSIATFDRRSGRFHVTDTGVTLAPETTVIAYNASNARHVAPGLKAYLADLVAGADGPRGHDTNMRWLAAAVGELHRIMRQGGVFLYPADSRPEYGSGHLRLLYEAFPIAFLMEQAGGAATDGRQPILQRTAETLHQQTPLIFGSRAEVATISRYLDATPD